MHFMVHSGGRLVGERGSFVCTSRLAQGYTTIAPLVAAKQQRVSFGWQKLTGLEGSLR